VKVLDGWIFDVYPAGQDMVVWVIDTEGRAHCLRDTFTPAFFVGGDPAELLAVAHFLIDQGWSVKPSRTKRTELFSGHTIGVLQVEVTNLNLFTILFERLTRAKPKLNYYNGDIPLPQMYFFARNAFPLAFCHFVLNGDNRILALEVDDSPWALDYKLPPLKRMVIRMEGDAVNPNHGYRAPLVVETEDATRELNGDDPRALLETLRDLLVRHDPDLIATDWGDSFILPRLLQMSKKFNIPLPFNRDSSRPPQFRPPNSYFSYGRIVYKTASQVLFGRSSPTTMAWKARLRSRGSHRFQCNASSEQARAQASARWKSRPRIGAACSFPGTSKNPKRGNRGLTWCGVTKVGWSISPCWVCTKMSPRLIPSRCILVSWHASMSRLKRSTASAVPTIVSLKLVTPFAKSGAV